MPPQEQHHHKHLAPYIALLIAIAIIASLAYLFFPGLSLKRPVQLGTLPDGFPPSAPAPTDRDLVSAQQGFQHLVQYTAAGFRPAALTLSPGERVRFTNNAGAPVQFAVGGETSGMLQIGQYWERAFAESDTVQAQGSMHTLEVTVQ